MSNFHKPFKPKNVLRAFFFLFFLLAFSVGAKGSSLFISDGFAAELDDKSGYMVAKKDSKHSEKEKGKAHGDMMKHGNKHGDMMKHGDKHGDMMKHGDKHGDMKGHKQMKHDMQDSKHPEKKKGKPHRNKMKHAGKAAE